MDEKQKLVSLADAISEYVKFMRDSEKAFAILYTPSKCHLALMDRNGEFNVNNDKLMPQNVFEARIFNDNAELRWLHESNGNGRTAIISDSKFPNNAGTIPQTYLLWGESMGASDANGWTQFAESRIGSFFVPINTITGKNQRAQFTAVEYLGEFEDGNVAIVDERLTGIEIYTGD